MNSSDIHNQEIHLNERHWDKKEALRSIYRGFYQLIRGQINVSTDSRTIEFGSGIGKIKEVIPECVTTDIFANPWLDRVENIYQTSFDDAFADNVILFDVFHHLEYPGLLFRELNRIVRPGGKVVIFDPFMSFLSLPVYGIFHHEPVDLRNPIEWLPQHDISPNELPYFAAQSRATRIFHKGELREKIEGFQLVYRQVLPAWDYMFSGGFSKPQMLPAAILTKLSWFQNHLIPWPTIFGTRILVTLRRDT
ncbi:methyltransferase domain-containing protein [Oscillatoria laete-virens NRMC-F 0139]|nr:class I SAM-dependent methyltransferase [Oscillatoria laete-virens]MDL5054690.1 methyltransferase domain-containing protein [Oscillatoria laete-virens NRMC-F 0139]